MLAEFKQAVSPYLTDIEEIEYQNSSESHCIKKDRACSVLIIQIASKEQYKKLKLDPVSGNWDDEFIHTKELKSAFN